MIDAGWAIAHGEVFLAEPSDDLHLRLSYGVLPPDALKRGAQVLASVVRSQMKSPMPLETVSEDWTPLV
jgi:DNA-binding transcriptional MocR family regulator